MFAESVVVEGTGEMSAHQGRPWDFLLHPCFASHLSAGGDGAGHELVRVLAVILAKRGASRGRMLGSRATPMVGSDDLFFSFSGTAGLIWEIGGNRRGGGSQSAQMPQDAMVSAQDAMEGRFRQQDLGAAGPVLHVSRLPESCQTERGLIHLVLSHDLLE